MYVYTKIFLINLKVVFTTTLLTDATFISFFPTKPDFYYQHFGFTFLKRFLANYETSNSRVFFSESFSVGGVVIDGVLWMGRGWCRKGCIQTNGVG